MKALDANDSLDPRSRVSSKQLSAAIVIQLVLALLLLGFAYQTVVHKSRFDFNNQYYGAKVERQHHSYLNYHRIRSLAKNDGRSDWYRLREPSGPPTLLNLVFAPLSLLPYGVAIALFAVLYWVVTALTCYVIAPKRLWSVVLLFVLFSYPNRLGLEFGNVSIFVAALIAFVGMFVKKRNWKYASIILGFASALKLYPAILILFLPWRRKDVHRPFIATALVTTAISSMFPYPHLALREWAYSLGLAKNRFGNFGGINSTISGVISSATHHIELAQVVAVICLIGILAVAYLVKNWNVERRFTFGIISMLPLLPVAWAHYYVLVFAALPWVFENIAERRKQLWLLIGLSMFLWVPPFNTKVVGWQILKMVPEMWLAMMLCIVIAKIKPSDELAVEPPAALQQAS